MCVIERFSGDTVFVVYDIKVRDPKPLVNLAYLLGNDVPTSQLTEELCNEILANPGILIAVVEIGAVCQRMKDNEWGRIRAEALGDGDQNVSERRIKAIHERFGEMQTGNTILKPRRVLLIPPHECVLCSEYKRTWFAHAKSQNPLQVIQLNDEAAQMIHMNIRFRATIGLDSVRDWRSAMNVALIGDFDSKGFRKVCLNDYIQDCFLYSCFMWILFKVIFEFVPVFCLGKAPNVRGNKKSRRSKVPCSGIDLHAQYLGIPHYSWAEACRISCDVVGKWYSTATSTLLFSVEPNCYLYFVDIDSLRRLCRPHASQSEFWLLIRANSKRCFGTSQCATEFWDEGMTKFCRDNIPGLTKESEDGMEFQRNVQGKENIVALAECSLLNETELLNQKISDYYFGVPHGSTKPWKHAIKYMNIFKFPRPIHLSSYESIEGRISMGSLSTAECQILQLALRDSTNGIMSLWMQVAARSLFVSTSKFILVL